jgi:hypothetical protein
MDMSNYISDFDDLSKHIQHQLIEYAEFLLGKYGKNKKSKKNGMKLSFSWENGLKELKNNFSSVDLQHKINDLR